MGARALSGSAFVAVVDPVLRRRCEGRATLVEPGLYPLPTLRDYEDRHAVNGRSVGCAACLAAAAEHYRDGAFDHRVASGCYRHSA